MIVPFHRPCLGQEERREIAEVLESGWLTSGPKAAQLEAEFRARVQAPFAAAVSSGTAGLHVALTALGVGPGDEVITTPLTFCSTIHAIAQTGATPVLADVGNDGNIDPEFVAQLITRKTKAILPVHLGGLACDLGRLRKIAAAHGLFVIEDAAHAVGTSCKGQEIGSGSDAVVFSFYANKNMTSAEGGMVTTKDREIDARIRRLSLHGIDRDTWARELKRENWKYEVVESGFKYNLSDLHAAVGLAQLRKLGRFVAARRELAVFYHSRFEAVEEIELPAGATDRGHSWHLYALRLRLDRLRIDRDEFIRRLNARGIGASVHFIPIPLHRAFAGLVQEPQTSCRRALELYPRLVSIPLYPGLTMEQAEHVASGIIEIARSNHA